MLVDGVKNTIIFFMGEVHNCPAAPGLLEKSLEELDDMGIPQVVCCEQAHNTSLEEKNALEIKLAEGNQVIISNMFSASSRWALIKDPSLHFPYFTEQICKTTIEVLQHVMSEGESNKTARLVMNYINNLQNLELNKTLSRLQIPYQGIETDLEVHNERVETIYRSSNELSASLVQSLATRRTLEMRHRLFEKAIPLLKENCGVVWINCGVEHIYDLAVVILKYIEEHSAYGNRSFTVLPIACFSGYAENKDYLISRIEELKNNLDKGPLAKWSKKVNFHIVDDVVETSKFKFESNKFTELMKFVKQTFYKPNFYHIPNWSDNKSKFVEVNYGKVMKLEGEDATVSIASERMLAPLRNELGIERKSLNFQKLPGTEETKREEVARRRGLLEDDPLITVEPTPNPQVLLVTYPKSKENLVVQVNSGKL